ncbi:GNAT family N-acetyltransferase [Nocardioides sp. cx-173]|uniref:GNAT family N-acetyltransferase n=1 Tax=Nocardioides sp. cx-173 TaxID=2898796 RepID=UPI001E5C364A|nr:GNAT family N-acetyltransferase [Nocardioides sp. cx-173]MCD4524579.1 GNAT family N-acetyltransferase [Nocardioides sp. cx-173]UGB42937.1 GNAT family N-acetyltransferase [Nocardioides sp. cx-173]
MPVPVTLTDGVVTLRPHRHDDAPGVLEQCQDPLSVRWTSVPVPYSLAEAEAYVDETVALGWLADTEWSFAIEAEGRFGGTVSLRNEGAGRAEIAYGAHPWIRGTGHVHRALRLLLDWGFDTQGLTAVIWWSHRGNWASRRTAWRLGFQVDGTVRRWLTQRDEIHDAWVGTLLREDPREPRSTWLECPVLTGDGVRLRPLVPDDAPRIQEACAEERTQHWLGQLPSPYTLEDAHAYVESRTSQLAEATGVTWAVTAPDDDRLLGTIGWFNWTPGAECEIGYWTHPDARGRGLMTRAMGLLTRHVLQDPGVARVTAYAAVDNTASRRVIEANGYRQFGVERLGALVRDGRADMALYDVLASAVAPRR